MHKDTKLLFTNPVFRDELSELVREGAQRIIRHAVEAELGAFLEEHAGEHDGGGRRALVRNGYLPSREGLCIDSWSKRAVRDAPLPPAAPERTRWIRETGQKKAGAEVTIRPVEIQSARMLPGPIFDSKNILLRGNALT